MYTFIDVKTLTVRLPDTLVDEIEAESRKRGLLKSDVVRERLERARPKIKLPPHLESIADLIGSVDDDLPAMRYPSLRTRCWRSWANMPTYR